MFLSVPVTHSIDFEDQKLELQTGLLAKQATQTVLAKIGETTVLAAVVVGKEKGGDYFPLQIVYEERLYAAGKIKGSRFVKREGKPTDNAVLTGRMVDRSLRSLFSPYLRTEIQVVITVLSLDNVNPPDTLAVIAASSALTLCGLLPKENLPNFDFCHSHQKTWSKNAETRERAVAIIQIKNTEKFVSFTKKNTEEFYKNGYFLPGGGIEIGENSQEAAARETLEELGIGNLMYLESLGKCQISLPYDGNISQNVEFYEWFEIAKSDLENLQKAEKDDQNWEIKLVSIPELRTNNWPQLNMILDKLEDRILAKELNLLSFEQSQSLEIGNLKTDNLQTKEIENSSNLNKFVTKLENTKIFTGPVSSVRLGLEIEPLGGIFLKKIEDLVATIGSEEIESWKESLSKVVLEKEISENNLENNQKIENQNTDENENNLSKLQKIILEIAQTLDKNNSEDLDFIRQIGNFLGRQKSFLAIYFKEIYKKTTRLSKSEIWAKYPAKFNFVINPSYEMQTLSKMDLVVSGNGQNIVMVECGAKIIPENIIAEGFDVACQKLQILTDFQTEFVKKYQNLG